ncbi:hypothetical protein SAMN05661091_4637 [Paenibacillus uliginis N3/975]|uniref:Sporulation lipoprotein YhcN/YlaJ (Spore_YhcN_YlaJ) n=1 Tax=Paenibacillus uliginis N3/975 TaxID=1313296 RepID=A0A1X7HNK4_9BACL|nr:YhcN/YlaJ family sporulation lipoprotein [Paenibacillus uliginis]SMF89408.1 hypothetical protein SAMN05661091_4637 [Paenibacillus uliginis N3/975]
MIKSKALSLTLSAAMIVSIAGLAGCGTPAGNTTRTNNITTKNTGRTGVNMFGTNNTRTNNLGTNNYNGTQHDLTNLKYSPTLSSKVSKVKGVRDAHVFVANNKAYVALSLDNQHRTDGNMTGMSTGRTGPMSTYGTTRNRNDGAYGTTGSGSMGLLRGLTNPTRTYPSRTNPSAMHPSGTNSTGTLDNNTGLGRTTGNGTFGVRGYNTMGPNRTGLMGTNGTDGTTGRYGMMNDTTGNGGMMNGNSVPKDVRESVSSKVRKTVPSCDQVYVSADSDFYNQSTGYAGNNVDGNRNGNGNGNGYVGNVAEATGDITRDIGAYINRIFPLNVNNRNGNMFNNNNDGLFDNNNRTNR